MTIKRITDNKHEFLELLLLADPDERMIGRYLDRGELFALYDENRLKSVCGVTDEGNGLCELKNLATVPDAQGQGYASRLVRHAIETCRPAFSTMQVGTGNVPKTIRFYEKCGFTLSHRIRDFFTTHYPELIVEDGILLTDMIYLSQTLR